MVIKTVGSITMNLMNGLLMDSFILGLSILPLLLVGFLIAKTFSKKKPKSHLTLVKDDDENL